MLQQWRRIEAVVGARRSTVAGGPFSGLLLGTVTSGSDIPKALGSYELEIHPWIEETLAVGHPHIVNVGAGEGYYAVGIARRLPQARVVAFELNEVAQNACQRNAEMNGCIGRVEVRGLCTTDDLQNLCGPQTLLIIDCEGCEVDLIDPDAAPSLRATEMIIETHDFLVKGALSTIRSRLHHTHDLLEAVAAPRDPDDFPILSALDPVDRRRALDEGRPSDQVWLWARPRIA